MKNTILYNYGIQIEEINECSEGFTFYEGYQKYIFYKTNLLEKDILSIKSFLSNITNKYSKIISTRQGDVLCDVDGVNYVLLKLEVPENEEIIYSDILTSLIPANDRLKEINRSQWGTLWSAKIDYLEYQVSELAKDYPVIKSSFNYYIGLAENAIEYYNAINKSSSSLYLMQKRIKYPNLAFNYYNPLTLVVDYKVRNAAEYIKSYFFNEVDKDVEKILDYNCNYNEEEYNLLFARLLYPSYYFDELTEVLEHKKNEDSLLKYIDLASEYEKFLKKCLVIFSKRAKVIKVEWLL